jgi:hypothetical protein
MMTGDRRRQWRTERKRGIFKLECLKCLEYLELKNSDNKFRSRKWRLTGKVSIKVS